MSQSILHSITSNFVKLSPISTCSVWIVGLHANSWVCVCPMKLCCSNQTVVFCICHKSPTNLCTHTSIAFQLSEECSSVMAQSKSHVDSTEHGRKCIFVTNKELAWVLSIEPEQLELIKAFVGGRDAFAAVP